MKNLFNNISESEKNRILEMHSGKKNVISEQGIGSGPKPYPGTKNVSQNSQQVYKKIADDLYNSMKGLSSSEDSKNVEKIIYDKIKTPYDWDGVVKAFGVRDGENFDQWLKGEFRINYDQIIHNLVQRGALEF